MDNMERFNMEQLRESVQNYIDTYGKEKVKAAIDDLLKLRKGDTYPYRVLDPAEIQATIKQLDAGCSDVIHAGDEKEKLYQEKAELVKRKTQLETDIKLVEAQAIMDIRGDSSRNQYIINDDGEKVAMTNDTMRDAYRRNKSKDQRAELAEVEAKIAKIDQQLADAVDKKDTVKEVNENIRAKAALQAALLEYLS